VILKSKSETLKARLSPTTQHRPLQKQKTRKIQDGRLNILATCGTDTARKVSRVEDRRRSWRKSKDPLSTNNTTVPLMLGEHHTTNADAHRGLQSKYARAKETEERAHKVVNQRARDICREIPDAKGLLKCVLTGFLGDGADGAQQKAQRVNAFTIITRAFFRVQDRFDTWKDVSRALGAQRKHGHAVILQAFFRRQIATGERALRHTELQNYNQRQRDENDSMSLDRATCARDLQRMYRGHHGRRTFLDAKTERNASLVLTRWCRCLCFRFGRLARIAKAEQWEDRAGRIQRRWLVFNARRKLRVLMKIHKVEVAHKEQLKKSRNARNHFKDEGAAVVLQRWWHRKVRQLASFQKSLQNINKSRKRCCVSIQSTIRMFVARALFLRRQIDEVSAIVCIQCATRASLARHRSKTNRTCRLEDRTNLLERIRQHRQEAQGLEGEVTASKVLGETKHLALTFAHKSGAAAREAALFVGSNRTAFYARKATILQKVWRGRKCRRRIRRKNKRVHEVERRTAHRRARIASTQIEATWRGVYARVLVSNLRWLRATMRVQSQWRRRQATETVACQRQRVYGANRIRFWWKVQRIERWNRKRRKAATQIQRCGRLCLSSIYMQSIIKNSQQLGEVRVLGAATYGGTLEAIKDRAVVHVLLFCMKLAKFEHPDKPSATTSQAQVDSKATLDANSKLLAGECTPSAAVSTVVDTENSDAPVVALVPLPLPASTPEDLDPHISTLNGGLSTTSVDSTLTAVSHSSTNTTMSVASNRSKVGTKESKRKKHEKKIKTGGAEVYALFERIVTGGAGKDKKPGVDGPAFARLLKQSPGLMSSKALGSNQIDIIFAKHKSKGTKHLAFPQFATALIEIADTRFKRPKFNNYRKHVQVDARFLRLLYEHIFKSPPGVDVDLPDRLERRVRHSMVLAACKIQRRFRFKTGRQQGCKWVSTMQKQREIEFMSPHVLKVQTQWRRIKSCKLARIRAQQVYKKYVDELTGEPYWFNGRIGTIFVTIPYCLGHDNHDVTGDTEPLHLEPREEIEKIVGIPPPEVIQMPNDFITTRLKFLYLQCSIDCR
jgi:hypothetical protein